MKKILVVDDEEMIRTLISMLLSDTYEVVTASSGAEAVELFGKEKPDLVLLDLMMPGMDGYTTLETLHDKYGQGFPAIFLTADVKEESESRGFETGARDYIKKPVQPEVLKRRINIILENEDRIRELRKNSQTDLMTGLLNRKFTEYEINKCLDEGEEGVFMIMDVDSFKPVNDVYGHGKGDDILIAVTHILQESLRKTDIIGRLGGDEFAAFCKGEDATGMVSLWNMLFNERLIEEAKKILGEDMSIPLGISVGAVETSVINKNFNALYEAGDSALYEVKKNGKHGYRFFEKQKEEPKDDRINLFELLEIFGARNKAEKPMVLGKESFQEIYRYMQRLQDGIGIKALATLITIIDEDGKVNAVTEEMSDVLLNIITEKCIVSDVVLKLSDFQYMLILPAIQIEDSHKRLDEIKEAWKKSEYSAYELIID